MASLCLFTQMRMMMGNEDEAALHSTALWWSKAMQLLFYSSCKCLHVISFEWMRLVSTDWNCTHVEHVSPLHPPPHSLRLEALLLLSIIHDISSIYCVTVHEHSTVEHKVYEFKMAIYFYMQITCNYTANATFSHSFDGQLFTLLFCVLSPRSTRKWKTKLHHCWKRNNCAF